jgi:hypothetical protein
METATQARLIRAGALCGLCAALLDLPVIAVFAQLEPGYNRFESFASALGARGSPNGRLISAWWVVYGVLLVLFSLSLLRSSRPRTWLGWVGPLLVLIFAAGDGIGSGVFRCDPGCAGATPGARMHLLVSSIGSVALIPAPVFMWSTWRHEERWRGYRTFTLVIQGIGLLDIAALALAETREAGFFAGNAGLFQRFFLLTYYVWIVGVALKLLRGPGHAGSV